jgi:hypothetical protein
MVVRSAAPSVISLRSEQVPTGVPLLSRLNRGGFFVVGNSGITSGTFTHQTPPGRHSATGLTAPWGLVLTPIRTL